MNLKNNFFTQLPNKFKSFYLAWLLAHIFIFIRSGNGMTRSSLDGSYRYWRSQKLDFFTYDYTELIFYSLAPIFIYFIIKFWQHSKINNSKNQLSDKLKAGYIAWIFTNLFLFLYSGNLFLFLSSGDRFTKLAKPFYPIKIDNYGVYLFDYKTYDYTELFFYSIAPIILYYIIKYWKTDKQNNNIQ